MSRPIILKSIEEDVRSRYPYFFQNELIDKNIYIVQKSINISNALYILDVWKREKFNIGEIDRYIDVEIPYTQYFYNNNNDIKKVDVGGGSEDYKIICYKKDDGFNVCALLKY
jgi:hypothetical protein